MRVWAVVSGEMHEGGTVTGVFSSRESAVAAALQTRCCFDGGWQQDNASDDCWKNGCDYVKVEPFEVQ